MASRRSSTDELLLQVRAFGLAYPGAHTKSPWPGHLDLAVNDKTFAYLGLEGEPFKISCKLPRSADHALMLPHTQPTGYGLGKSGWVSMSLPPGATVPLDLLQAWIDESYRAQAPKKLLAQLDARSGSRDATTAKPAAKKATSTKAAATKAAATKAPATKPPATRGSATKAPATKGSASKAPATKGSAAKPSASKAPARRAAAKKAPPNEPSAARR